MKTAWEYNIDKARFLLTHHPDLQDLKWKEKEGGQEIIVDCGDSQILIDDSLQWVKDSRGNLLSGRNGFGVFRHLQALTRLWSLQELRDLIGEILDYSDSYGLDDFYGALRDVFMYVGLGDHRKIGFRKSEVPKNLLFKAGSQLSRYTEIAAKPYSKGGEWDWEDFGWVPLKELVRKVNSDSDEVFEAQWKDGLVDASKSTLFRHYQEHGKLNSRWAMELQKRITYLNENGQWPEWGEK